MASSGDVFAALKVAWDAVAATTLAGLNGPYRDRRPAGDTPGFPYVIFSSTANSRSMASCANEYWLHSFRFIVYNTTPELVEGHIDTIGSVFDTATLTLAAGSVVRVKRMSEGYDEPDKNVYRGYIEYEVLRAKAR